MTDGYLSVILKTMNKGHPLFWWVFVGDKHARALFGACFSCFLAHVFQPIKLCLVHVSLVFLHMVAYVLKIYHNFESYQNMLTTLSFYFLYHKLQFYFVCHADLHLIYM